jgi:hypothetical protein
MAPFPVLTISSSGAKGRRMSPCLADVDPGDNSTVFRRVRFGTR